MCKKTFKFKKLLIMSFWRNFTGFMMIAASPSLKMNRSYLRVLCILFITKCNLEKKINHFKTKPFCTETSHSESTHNVDGGLCGLVLEHRLRFYSPQNKPRATAISLCRGTKWVLGEYMHNADCMLHTVLLKFSFHMTADRKEYNRKKYTHFLLQSSV